MTSRPEFVFGYGSLAARLEPAPTREIRPHGFVAELSGARRTWGVAMDNRRDLPGYKYYTDAAGRRPAVFVAYLDLLPSDARVNGVCLPVDAAILPALDRRERNYGRVDVSDRVDAGGARVWAYVGTDEARERLAEGLRSATAVIDAGYVRAVEGAFAALGADEHRACRPSLDPAGLPVVELVRRELP
ncbi:MAG TPA: gamma-glutamylcyclotransferase family protein [Solirubrobacteraceae bacterium]|nr:gamma-glutamylcyclotransferase family protein [Solirubrobacteraceae bacterium]